MLTCAHSHMCMTRMHAHTYTLTCVHDLHAYACTLPHMCLTHLHVHTHAHSQYTCAWIPCAHSRAGARVHMLTCIFTHVPMYREPMCILTHLHVHNSHADTHVHVLTWTLVCTLTCVSLNVHVGLSMGVSAPLAGSTAAPPTPATWSPGPGVWTPSCEQHGPENSPCHWARRGRPAERPPPGPAGWAPPLGTRGAQRLQPRSVWTW